MKLIDLISIWNPGETYKFDIEIIDNGSPWGPDVMSFTEFIKFVADNKLFNKTVFDICIDNPTTDYDVISIMVIDDSFLSIVCAYEIFPNKPLSFFEDIL